MRPHLFLYLMSVPEKSRSHREDAWGSTFGAIYLHTYVLVSEESSAGSRQAGEEGGDTLISGHHLTVRVESFTN